MHKLTEKYRQDVKSFEDYRIKVEVLLRELLIQNNVSFHKIESRIKDPIHLEEKIIRKHEKYNDLSDITDLVGLRVITFFEDEVDKVAKIVESEFIIDEQNSIDKRKLESDRFGYMSLHYVASLNSERKKLTEYKRFQDIKIEIQIRSILQHAWAEIEHDIGYKGEITIPDTLKRNFHRVAALLETADIEFVKIREGQKKYERSVAENIKRNPEEVEINSTSLRSYIYSSSTVKEIDIDMTSRIGWIVKDDQLPMDWHIKKLNFLGIRTIKELDTLLKANHLEIPKFFENWANNKNRKGTVHKGICVFYLAYVLVAKRNNPAFADAYFRKFVYNSEEGGDRILATYKRIKP
jgi:putative GTP pyrophosphokinase